MLFDPFEKQFDLPARLVDLSDSQCGQYEVVSQEFEPLVCLRIEVVNTPQCIRIDFRRLNGGEDHRVIGSQACECIHWMRIAALKNNILFCTHDEECGTKREDEEPFEIDVAAVIT